MGDPHEWANLVPAKTSANQNSITPSVTFLSRQPEGRGWFLVCQKRAKWELIGNSSANTGGHYEREAITQIKYTAGGKWSWNSEAKKEEGKEGKYKLKRLVNIIMCASCNHPFKCRYRRGALTDGRPHGQRRHEETEVDGTRSKVTTLLPESWSFRSRRRRCSLCFSSVSVRRRGWRSESERHRCSANVTDWSSRWTVKIKRMTNKHAAYTARGANPLPPPPELPFEELPPRSTRRQWPEGGHTTCWRATSVIWSSWQDPSPSASPHHRLPHSRGSAGDSSHHLPTGDQRRPDSSIFLLLLIFVSTNPEGSWTFCASILDIVKTREED